MLITCLTEVISCFKKIYVNNILGCGVFGKINSLDEHDFMTYIIVTALIQSVRM